MSEQQQEQTGAPVEGFTSADTSDVAGMGYEQARAELVETVGRLEAGGAVLEESLALWERGEALAKRCEVLLQGAAQRVEAVIQERAQADAQAGGQSGGQAQ